MHRRTIEAVVITAILGLFDNSNDMMKLRSNNLGFERQYGAVEVSKIFFPDILRIVCLTSFEGRQQIRNAMSNGPRLTLL